MRTNAVEIPPPQIIIFGVMYGTQQCHPQRTPLVTESHSNYTKMSCRFRSRRGKDHLIYAAMPENNRLSPQNLGHL